VLFYLGFKNRKELIFEKKIFVLVYYEGLSKNFIEMGA
jgi:hypothetical protein